MKKIFKNSYIKIFILIILSLLVLTGCSSNDDSEDLGKKTEQEVAFLDSEIIKYINSLNNISGTNYKVNTTDINEETSQSKTGGDSSSKEEESSDKNSGSSSGSDSESGSESNSSSSSGSGDSQSSKKSQKTSEMVSDTILNSNDEIDWNTLKNNIETLYSSWSVIVLDLYKLGVDNEDILSFSTELDNLIVNAKEEDKQRCINSLAKMYQYLPSYLDKYSNNSNLINLIKTKASVLNAYSLVEQEDWQTIQTQLAQAETNYMPVLNNVSEKQNKIYNVNKSYILLKELENSIQAHDKDVFYIKYKSLIEELNVLQQKNKD